MYKPCFTEKIKTCKIFTIFTNQQFVEAARAESTAHRISEGVGGGRNASTDREMTVFWCKVALPHYKIAFAVLMDMVLNSILDPEEVEKAREVIQEE